MEKDLVHVAYIQLKPKGSITLFLKKRAPSRFIWMQQEEENRETETEISGNSPEEAILFARRHWKKQNFCTLNCGFRYTLPDRDEHGINALFSQMSASYTSSSGVYFDEELGCNCIVSYASLKARNLLSTL